MASAAPAAAAATEAASLPGEDQFPIVYVIFGPGGTPLARAVVPRGASCPALAALDEVSAKLLANASVGLRAKGTEEMPFAFPVRVCEVQLPRNLPASSATLGGRPLPAITSSPSTYALIGDTGMRVKPKNLGTCAKLSHEKLYGIKQCAETVPFDPKLVEGHYQATAEWPLESIMDRAAEEEPDVVVHVGDYLYRQGPCAQGKGCEDINNATDVSVPGMWGDNWHGWFADFFEPSAALLASAPWIVLRGNHESCGRAGHGFFMFLDPRPLPAEWTADYCIERTDMYAVPFEHEQFLVVDDNFVEDVDIDDFNYCPQTGGAVQGKALSLSRYDDKEQSKSRTGIEEEIGYFAAQFRMLEVASQSHATNFYLGHHPLLAVVCYKGQYANVDWTLQQALAANPAVLDRVSAAITGHVHFFQGLVFENHSLPMSLVVGNGGTLLDGIRLAESASVDGLEAFGGSKVQRSFSAGGIFGFSAMRRAAASSGGFELRSIQAGNSGSQPSDMWVATFPAVRRSRRLQAATGAAPLPAWV